MWHFQQAQQSLNFSVQQRNSTASNKRRLLNVYLKLNIIFCLKQAYLHSDWRHQIERSRRRTELGGKSNYGRTSGKNGKFEFYIEKEIVLKSGICYSVQIYPVGSTPQQSDRQANVSNERIENRLLCHLNDSTERLESQNRT